MCYTVHCSEQSINADSTERTALNVNNTETPAINADSTDTAAINVDSTTATYTSANKHSRARGKASLVQKCDWYKVEMQYLLHLGPSHIVWNARNFLEFCILHLSLIFWGGGVGGVGKVWLILLMHVYILQHVRVSRSPVLRHHNMSSPGASGVATGSAVGLQLTPMQCTTPTNQLIRNVSHHSLESESCTLILERCNNNSLYII